MSILIRKPGILSTIQDLGRYGYRRYGINTGGAMDRTAARLTNILVGNDESEPVVELHYPAAEIEFGVDAEAAIGGADFAPMLDGAPVDTWRPFFARGGSTLKFIAKRSGNRAYLAVKGGFRTDKWLNSSSTNLAAKIGGHKGRKLEAGDIIECSECDAPREFTAHYSISTGLRPRYSPFPTVRIVRGAGWDDLGGAGKDQLLGQDFTISNSANRMGFRLAGEAITLEKPVNLVSSAVTFGTIQNLPDGQLIILMADHQTAGGYPRIAHVISVDLPLVAQLGAKDKIAFHLVDLEEAERLMYAFERDLNLLKAGVRFAQARG